MAPPMKHSRFNDQGDEKEGWRFDRKIPISVMVVIVLQCVAGLWMIADMKKDIELGKAADLQQVARDDRQDRVLAEALTVFRGDLLEVNRNLTRLLERMPR
jgi:hypothetical protein